MKKAPFKVKGEIVLPGAETLPEDPREKRLRILTRVFLFASAFLIPALTALAVFASYGFAPFGDKSMLIMDMSGQYVEFLTALRTVRSPADLFFSWGKVLGSNYTGVYAYYASSPLSWLLLLFPDSRMPEAVLFLTVLKIGLCGLGMSVFLRGFCLRHSRRYRLGAFGPSSLRHLAGPFERSREWLSPALRALILLFSTLYALCSYNCVYSMCVMWLDGVFMLPLILYFTEKLVDEGRMAGLILSFAYIFLSNYYVAYMCGVFSVIYFAFYFVDRRRGRAEKQLEKPLRNRFYRNRIFKFVIAVSAAAALTAWLWLPTLFSLIEGKIGFTNSTYPDAFNYDFGAFVRKLFIGEYDAITNRGAPFFYGGMAVFIALPMFFMNRNIKARSRIFAGAILAFLLLSTLWTPLDNAWHIFQHPNWFPYRWTFVLAFFCVYLAFRGVAASGSLSAGYYPGAILGMYALCLTVSRDPSTASSALSPDNFTAPSDGSVRKQFIYTLAVVFAFVLIDLARRLPSKISLAAGKKFRITLSRLLAVLTALFLIAVTVTEQHFHWKKLLEGLDRAHSYETAASYSEYRKTMSGALKIIDGDRDENGVTGFGGVGQNFSRSYNEAISFGYRSVAHYSSAFNRHVNEFLGNFGYAQAYLWNLNFGSTAVTDSLFGLTYMLNGAGIHDFDKEGLVEIGSLAPPEEYGLLGTANGAFDISVYKNPYAARGPFLMSGDPAAFGWQGNCFESQNLLLKLSSGVGKNVFNRVRSELISISLYDGAYEKADEPGVYSMNGGRVTYNISMPEGGTLYAYFGKNRNDETKLRIGDSSEQLSVYRGETNCIQRIGTYAPGEVATFTFTIGRWSSLYTKDNIFYVLDTDALAEHSAAVNSRALSITKFSTGSIKGTLPPDNTGGAMLIQVPYDSGWTVKADGKPVATSSLKDGLLLADIPAGTVSVEIRYAPKGLLPGAVLSAAACFAIAVNVVVRFVIKKRKAS